MVNTRIPNDECTPLLPTHLDAADSEKIFPTHNTHDSSLGFPPITRRTKHLFCWILVALITLTLLFSRHLVAFCRNTSARPPALAIKAIDSDDYYDSGAPFAPLKIQKLWASYAPYYSVERYQPPPKDCQLTQVNILQRHAARYPTLGQSMEIVQAILKIQTAESYTDERFQFIADYEYDLGVADIIPFGAHQYKGTQVTAIGIVAETSESGRKSFVRYPTLVNKTNLPFVRASGSKRVVDSAHKWIEGFTAGTNGTLRPPLAVIIPEINGYNNTLEDKSCPKLEHTSSESEEWQNIYAKPTADRLNTIAQGLPENLLPQDAEALILLCALETVAKEEYSRFCNLFDQDEFEGFEYSLDLDKFYFTGHGSRLGAVQGVGYINELLARLTHRPVHDHTQTNRTLDSNPETFPLDRGLYVDFSHDNLIAAVVSSMGLFKDVDGILDPKKPNQSREWYISRIVPFSGRMVVERMECGLPLSNGGGQPAIGVAGKEGERRKDRQRRRAEDPEDSVYVRILMNDAVQDLGFCEGRDEDGLRPLRAFVKSQSYARKSGEGDWEECFE